MLFVAVVPAVVVLAIGILVWQIGRGISSLAATVRRELPPGDLVRGPEQANYRGGSGAFSRVQGLGVLALTREDVLFRRLGPSMTIKIPRHDIVGVELQRWLPGSYRGGQLSVVLRLSNRAEVGFIVRDPQAWIALLEGGPAPPPADAVW